VASDYPNVEVREVNIMQAAERAADYKVFTTPFVVMNGKLTYGGIPRESELRAHIAQHLSVRDV
jgi:hypothetical protein